MSLPQLSRRLSALRSSSNFLQRDCSLYSDSSGSGFPLRFNFNIHFLIYIDGYEDVAINLETEALFIVSSNERNIIL